MRVYIKNKITLHVREEVREVRYGDTVTIDDSIAIEDNLVATFLNYPHHIEIIEYPEHLENLENLENLEDISKEEKVPHRTAKNKFKKTLEVEEAYEAECSVC